MYRGRPPSQSWGSDRGRGGRGGSGGGGGFRGRGHDGGWGGRQDGGMSRGEISSNAAPDGGKVGQLVCGHISDGKPCAWKSNSEVALTLHRADRHLVYPPGGKDELERIDPLLEEERREKARRARQGRQDEESQR